MNLEWNKKEVWNIRGDNCYIEVVNSKRKIPDELKVWEEGENSWFVYAYIYENHPLFKKFDGDSIFQDAANNLPLHGGCTFICYSGDGKSFLSVKVGADYKHLHDDRFSNYETQEDAKEVFDDAKKLLEYLNINYKNNA